MNTTIQTDVSAHITKRDVSFLSGKMKLAAHLYLPANIDTTKEPLSAIVVGHPGTAVKEQTSGLYARLLAEKGFITLAFDAAYQGESEGFPRGLEDPAQRVEDFKAAVSYLSTLDFVHPDRIGVLGICASGGYGITAAATDQGVKAIATVSAADIGRQFRNGSDSTQDLAVIKNMLNCAAAAFPIFPETEEQAKAMGLHVYEGWKYYCTAPYEHPRSAKTFTWSSVDRIAGFDAFSFVDMIAPRPLLMIVGSAAITKWITDEAMDGAQEPKELFVIEGATHVDLYYKDEFVKCAINKLESFFATKL
jgi:fermentation-respiration switch protein FrsA (DUF1100 family)